MASIAATPVASQRLGKSLFPGVRLTGHLVRCTWWLLSTQQSYYCDFVIHMLKYSFGYNGINQS